MKSTWIVTLCVLFSSAAFSQAVHHRGYITKKGTYVGPHMQSHPNHTKQDNYSTKGNVNPYTGKKGAKRAN